jgi:hypothetical protein
MVSFTTTILKFEAQGEKTGWTYIPIPEKIAQQLKPGNKKSFRVKGTLDQHVISGVALIPMGGGDFVMAFNAAMRKATGKQKGAAIKVTISADQQLPDINKDLLECLADEPAALAFFNTLPRSYHLYYSRWIDSAKTAATKTKRIALAVSSLARHMDFGEMIRSQKKDRDTLGQ